MPYLIPALVQYGLPLIFTGVGALGHWLFGKHTKKSAAAATMAYNANKPEVIPDPLQD